MKTFLRNCIFCHFVVKLHVVFNLLNVAWICEILHFSCLNLTETTFLTFFYIFMLSTWRQCSSFFEFFPPYLKSSVLFEMKTLEISSRKEVFGQVFPRLLHQQEDTSFQREDHTVTALRLITFAVICRMC